MDKDEFYRQWQQTVIDLKAHIHRKRVQVESYNKQKPKLEHGEALLQVDYSESYKNKQQNEIQSAYFGQTSFSLFTACVYYVDEKKSLGKRPVCVVSESNDRSRAAALTCIDLVIKEIEKRIPLMKVILWSDGCAAKLRSLFVFKLLADYRPDIQVEWNYNEAHHGKGPMDGIGGTVKNVVYRQVKSGNVTTNSAKQFFDAANRFVPTITTLFQKEEDVLAEPDDINQAQSIPATLIHKFVRTITSDGATMFAFYFLSNGKEPCFIQTYSRFKKTCGHVKENCIHLLCLNRHVHIAINSIWVKKNLQIG